jgi:GT2 family glycosyltransferase
VNGDRVKGDTAFWSLCTEALQAMHREEWPKAHTLLSRAGERISRDGSPFDTKRRVILQRYLAMLARRESRTGELGTERAAASEKSTLIRLSLVTSVFNRFSHLRATLPRNLESIRGYPDVELVVVDFGGSDSDSIAEYLDREFGFELLSGQLRYFRRIVPWQHFHMATAKNVAHRFARGEFLLSVDADNFVNAADLGLALEHFDQYPDCLFHQTIGPAPLSNRMWERYRVFPDSSHYHSEEVIWDGSCGRVGVSRKAFERVNGYNENFVGMGMDDIDFLIRCVKVGLGYRHHRISRSRESVFLDSGSASKGHRHGDNDTNWKRMDEELARNNLVPFYVTDSPPDQFNLYRPKCVHRSASARVTVFSSVFRGDGYINRFVQDVQEILKSSTDALVWLFDVIGSHSETVSERLRRLGEDERVGYFAVRHDPGLYQIWNVALRNIESTFTGNLNIDDLRGRGWLEKCLAPLEGNIADVTSPVTVPFRNGNSISYAEALAELRGRGKKEERWFECRVSVNGEGADARPKHERLIDGVYDHGDLFQVLPDGKLASFCIPNASAVWRRSLHDRVGYFDEPNFGCYTDLALWGAAGAAGMRFRQVDYPALFFVSDEQAHRKQRRDDKKLWSLALKFGSPAIHHWASRRIFDLSRVGGTYGDHHYLGWNWVRDRVAQHFVSTEGNMLLDMFVERTFFWNPNPDEREFVYEKDWLGFVHTTPHKNPVYSHKGQNLYSLISDRNFLQSLEKCRGLIVLSDANREFLESMLRAGGWKVPVFRLFHPNIPIEGNRAGTSGARESGEISGQIYHIGWHLRSFAPFARLAVDRSRKVLLVPKGVERNQFLNDVVNKDLALAGLGPIEQYVAKIYTASEEEYQRILRWGVIYNHYVEPAGSNLVSECISAESCLVLNRHKAFEEYLGKEYPLFFENAEEADRLIQQLEAPSFREVVRAYLRDLGSQYSVDHFCRELEHVGEHVLSGASRSVE